jgi:hypothetical protein
VGYSFLSTRDRSDVLCHAFAALLSSFLCLSDDARRRQIVRQPERVAPRRLLYVIQQKNGTLCRSPP